MYTSNSGKTISTAIQVSVIIPCYNNSRHLEETLQSVAIQDLTSIECLVIDDGSVDGSWDLAQKYVKSHLQFHAFRRPDNLVKGANSCRNYGAQMAKGKFLLFLDADDLLEKEALSYRVRRIPEGFNFAVFRTANFSTSINQVTPFSNLVNSERSVQEYLNLFLDYQIPWHTSSSLWKSSFFQKVNGFDPELQRFQDVDIHIRALTNPSVKLWVDSTSNFTSFYRKSEFHQEVTLQKRRFLLNQGFLFLSKLSENFGKSILSKTFGFAIYFAFRFEEVMQLEEIKKLRYFYVPHLAECRKELRWIFFLQQTFPYPSRFRKGLSYLIYRIYRSKNS